MSAPRVAAIVLTLNQREKTLTCLRSLRDAEQPPVSILLWDNGSTDGTEQAVRQALPDVVVHRHPENLGVASGRNAAAREAVRAFAPTHLLFLDNDMIVEPGFVRALARPFADDERLGQTQAKLRFLHDRTRLNDGGGCKIQFWLGRTRPVGFDEVDRGQRDRPTRCVACGGAMMVRTDLFLAHGGFDSTFDPFGPEDLDFSLRLRQAGYHALYVPDAVAYHEVSHTFGGGYSEQYAQHKSRHWFVFMRRHATWWQKAGFWLVGAPFLTLRLVVREARRGNLRAVRGVVRGGIDTVRARFRAR